MRNKKGTHKIEKNKVDKNLLQNPSFRLVLLDLGRCSILLIYPVLFLAQGLCEGIFDNGLDTLLTIALFAVILSAIIALVFGMDMLLRWRNIKPQCRYIVTVVVGIVLYVCLSYPFSNKVYAGIVAFVIMIVEYMFTFALEKICIAHSNKALYKLLLGIGIMVNICVITFFIMPGSSKEYDRYMKGIYEVDNEEELLSLAESRKYDIEELEYGIDKDIDADSVNLSNFISDYKGVKKIIRDIYFNYSIDNIPLAGKIWYPQIEGRCPVIFIIHGNHTAATKSYLGYDYIGEYLAENGYIVVSVDERFCNNYIDGGLTGENDARAVLLLENVRQVLEWNEEENNPLYHRIDEENIGLVGHSRGGEAVALAALFNKLEVYPDGGTIPLNYNFNINTVCAIAPTADQYMPADQSVELADVNYFLVQGGMDEDVVSFYGLQTYEDVSFSEDSECVKAYMYINNANHGQFNELWGRYDTSKPMSYFLNIKPIMEEEKQQAILKHYLKTCFDVTLKKDVTDIGYIKDSSNYEENEGVLVVQDYELGYHKTLCDFEEDVDLTTGSNEAVIISVQDMNLWKEETQNYDITGGDIDNQVVKLGWDIGSKSQYRLYLNDAIDISRDFSFDIMDVDDEAVEDGAYNLLSGKVIFKDIYGEESEVDMLQASIIYPPIPVAVSKLDSVIGKWNYKHIMTGVTIDTDMIKESNSKIDLENIDEIVFDFSNVESGKVIIDSIKYK